MRCRRWPYRGFPGRRSLTRCVRRSGLEWDQVAHVTATTTLARAIQDDRVPALPIATLLDLATLPGLPGGMSLPLEGFPGPGDLATSRAQYRAKVREWQQEASGRRLRTGIQVDDSLRRFVRDDAPDRVGPGPACVASPVRNHHPHARRGRGPPGRVAGAGSSRTARGPGLGAGGGRRRQPWALRASCSGWTSTTLPQGRPPRGSGCGAGSAPPWRGRSGVPPAPSCTTGSTSTVRRSGRSSRRWPVCPEWTRCSWFTTTARTLRSPPGATSSAPSGRCRSRGWSRDGTTSVARPLRFGVC